MCRLLKKFSRRKHFNLECWAPSDDIWTDHRLWRALTIGIPSRVQFTKAGVKHISGRTGSKSVIISIVFSIWTWTKKTYFNILFYQNYGVRSVWVFAWFQMQTFQFEVSLRLFLHWWLTDAIAKLLIHQSPHFFFFSLQIKPGCPLPAREKVTQDVTCLSQ